jgi:hypothetical protein
MKYDLEIHPHRFLHLSAVNFYFSSSVREFSEVLRPTAVMPNIKPALSFSDTERHACVLCLRGACLEFRLGD